MEQATIFNVQRFSIHDGPGIRTTLFFKGCPLRCSWCANPESQDIRPQLMVRDIRCLACGRCAAACPREAILLADGTRRFLRDRCDRCLKCVEACETGALAVVGRLAGVDELVEEAKRDLAFYRNTGGGVTLSGGEPMMQPVFAERLCAALKAEGLHVALDTSGAADPADFLRVLRHVDLVLFDVKTLDEARHRRATGRGNRLILENAGRAAAAVRTWFRVPLLRGFNDGEEEIRAVAVLARSLGVEKVSLLPYHEGGVAKRLQVGMDGTDTGEAAAPPEGHVESLADVVRECGVQAGIRS